VLETAGWSGLDAATKLAFAKVLRDLEGQGVRLITRASHPLVDRLEAAIADAAEVCNAITAWENRWWQRPLVDDHPDRVSAGARRALARAEAMSVADYRAALLQRQAAQLSYRLAAPLADTVITLACKGAGAAVVELCRGGASHRRPDVQLPDLAAVRAGGSAADGRRRHAGRRAADWDKSTPTPRSLAWPGGSSTTCAAPSSADPRRA
jgi:hypothetical protein